MSNTPIVRQELSFEREYGMHQNWWVRDRRIAGMPLTLFLYMLSHAATREVTPADAKRDLGLTDYAWKTAKNALRRHGFFVEVRDRWPAGSKAPMMRDGRPVLDRRGNPRYVELGGNLRVRVFTQDPKPGVDVGADGGVIVVDEPYEQWLQKQQGMVSTSGNAVAAEATAGQARTAPRNSHSGDGTAPRKSPPGEESQVSTALRNSHSGAPVDEIRNTHIKERENQGWLVGSNTTNQPTEPPGRNAREADAPAEAAVPRSVDVRAVDAELAGMVPGLSLEAIANEVDGRVDLATVDVVRAVRESVVRAVSKGRRVNNPAVYAALVILRRPEAFSWDAPLPVPAAVPATMPTPASKQRDREMEDRDACERGEHDWGPDTWAETDRRHCVRPRCTTPRAAVDPVFAELVDELDAFTGRAATGVVGGA